MGKFRAVPAVTSEFREVEDCLKSGQQVVELLDRLGVIDPGATTLQIGSGLGRVEMHLCRKVRYCYGVDISPAMVEKARTLVKAPNVEFVCSDGQGLSSWQDGSLDLIYSFLVFQHLRRDWVRSYMREASHKLRPSGQLVFQIPIDESGAQPEPPPLHPYGIRFYTRREIRKILADAGFGQVVSVRAVDGEVDTGEPLTNLVFVAVKQPV